MKKYMNLVLTAIFLLTITSCAANEKDPDNSDKITVVATIFPLYDFARQIAGDRLDLTMLLPPAVESHAFEPTPQDIIKIQNCDVFIYIGGKSDFWIHEALDSIDTNDMKIVTLMDCVTVAAEQYTEGMEQEHEHDESGHNEPEYDEHIWTSPKNAKLIVERISDALCEADVSNADFYKKNTADYIQKLNELDMAFQKAVDSGVRKTLIFADRFPFTYFANDYGLAYFAAFPGCAAETDASASTVAFLIDKVKAEKIPVVFHNELSDERMANTVCEETGAKKHVFYACHNIPKDDFQKGVTYLDLMTKNVDALKEALN